MPEPTTRITVTHAYSLQELVRWFKKMIVERGLDNSILTAEYCDELLSDLEVSPMDFLSKEN